MRARYFHDLVSGRRRGIVAHGVRCLLAAAEVPVRAGVWWRNRRYDRQDGLVTRLAVPVISVGNLTLGGTGKTPLVKWLARWFTERGVRVVLLSRGYGSEGNAPNDEAMELADCLPEVTHLQDRDRVAAGQRAIEEHGAGLLLLDDGFQHRRLARDGDIVLIDATEPFGYGRLFPRGALREPVASLQRAAVVCLTRSDLVDEAQRRAIRDRVARVAPEALWCESVAEPIGLLATEPGKGIAIEALQGARVALFCGIGNPGAFRSTIERLGAEVVDFTEGEDHHPYTQDDLHAMQLRAEQRGAHMLVCTHKDLVKVRSFPSPAMPLYALEIGAQFTHGREALEERLLGAMR